MVLCPIIHPALLSESGVNNTLGTGRIEMHQSELTVVMHMVSCNQSASLPDED